MAKKPGETDDLDVVEADDVVEDGPEDEAEIEAAPEGEETDEHVEAEETDEVDAPQPEKRRTANDTIRELRRRAQTAERERDEANARSQNFSRQPSVEDQRRMQAEENARYELMTPDEKIAHNRQRDEQRFNAAFGQVRNEIFESNDRSTWRTLCASEPAARQYAEEVEQKRTQLMRENGGFPIPRETIFNWLLGQKARERSARANGKQKRVAGARVDANTTKGTSARGDQVRDRRETNEVAARRKRVEGYQL